MEEELPPHYVALNFTLYNKIGDPFEHLYSFLLVMTLVDTKEELFY